MTDSNTIPISNRNSYSNIASLNTEESSMGPRRSEEPIHEETRSSSTTTATMTITQTTTTTASQTIDGEILPLTLRARPNVTWETDVIDNEGLGRKSSKRCCIFHKQRDFGESSTDSSGEESDGGSSSGSSSSSGGPFKNHSQKPIARPKQKKNPDFQRYHA